MNQEALDTYAEIQKLKIEIQMEVGLYLGRTAEVVAMLNELSEALAGSRPEGEPADVPAPAVPDSVEELRPASPRFKRAAVRSVA